MKNENNIFVVILGHILDVLQEIPIIGWAIAGFCWLLGVLFGKSQERKVRTKIEAKQQEVIIKHEARIDALERDKENSRQKMSILEKIIKSKEQK